MLSGRCCRNSFPFVSIKAVLQHHSVRTEFNRRTKLKDTLTTVMLSPASMLLPIVVRRVSDIEYDTSDKKQQQQKNKNRKTNNVKEVNCLFSRFTHVYPCAQWIASPTIWSCDIYSVSAQLHILCSLVYFYFSYCYIFWKNWPQNNMTQLTVSMLHNVSALQEW